MPAHRSTAIAGYEPTPAWVRLAPWLLGVVGVVATLLLAWSLREQARGAARSDFEQQATRAVAAARSELMQHAGQLHATKAFYDGSERVEDHEFQSFTDGLGRKDATLAFLWLEPVGENPEELRVVFSNPEDAPQPDLARREPVLVALRAARAADRAVIASAPARGLVRAADQAVLLALSVRRDGLLQGYVAQVLDLPRLLASVDGVSEGWSLTLIDATNGDPQRVAGAGEEEGWQYVETLDELGRSWQVVVTPPTGRYAHEVAPGALLALANGLLLTLLLVGLVAMATNRARLQLLVGRRTKDIQAAYDTLADEAERRVELMMEARALEKQTRDIISLVPHMIYVKDWYGRFLIANEATAEAYGTSVEKLTAAASFEHDMDVVDKDEILLEERELMEKGLSSVKRAVPFVDADGRRRLLHEIKRPFTIGAEKRPALLCVATDITDRQHAELSLKAQTRLLEQLARGKSPDRVLEEAVFAVEEIVPGMRASILEVTPDGGHLGHRYAPSLPSFYNEAVDGIEIGPTVGSCGASAATGELVVVEDVLEHPNWAPYRELTKRAGVRACWSQPILASDGEVLGTFAMYYAEPRGPEPHELELLRSMAHLAMLAIERSRAESNS